METGKKGWEQREELLHNQHKQTLEKIVELQSQNDILHDQIEALGAKLTLAHSQVSIYLNSILLISINYRFYFLFIY